MAAEIGRTSASLRNTGAIINVESRNLEKSQNPDAVKLNADPISGGHNGPVVVNTTLSIEEQVINGRNSSIASTSEASQRAEVAHRMQDVIGKIGDSGYTVDRFQALMKSIQNITSNNKGQRIDAINSLEGLIKFFSNANDELDKLGSNLDQKILDSISSVNEILENIRRANNSIRGERSESNKSKIQADMLEQITSLSEHIDIKFSFDKDGSIILTGANTGTLLVNGDISSSLQYVISDDDIISTGFSKGAIVLCRRDSAGHTVFGGTQLLYHTHSKMDAGGLSGLVQAKNEDLYSYQRSMNATYNSFLLQMNELHNDFMPQGGTNELFGQKELTLQSQIPNTGILRIGIMPNDNISPMQAYKYNMEIDLASLKGTPNVQSLIDATSSFYNPKGQSLTIGQFLDVKMLVNTQEITQGNTVQFGFELNLGDNFKDGTKFSVEGFTIRDSAGNEIFRDQSKKGYTASASKTKQQEAVGLEYEATMPQSAITFPLQVEVRMLTGGAEATVIYDVDNATNGLLNKKFSISEVISKSENVYNEDLSQELFISFRDRRGAEISDPLDKGFLEIVSKDGLKFVMMHDVDDANESLMNFFGLNDLFLSDSRDRSIFNGDSDVSKLFHLRSNAVDAISLGKVRGGMADGGFGEGYYVAGGSIDAISSYINTVGLFTSKFEDFTFDVERHRETCSNTTEFQNTKFDAINQIFQDIHKTPIEEILYKLNDIATLRQAMASVIQKVQDLNKELTRTIGS